jgi:hypothetical protein
MFEINQQTLATILQLAGQYFFPAAALLRALYSGYRGKAPEGMSQILAASLFSGLTAVTTQEQPDMNSILLELVGNTVFMVSLLSFIVIYILRMRSFGIIVDAIVGGLLAAAAWGVWVYVLGNTQLQISNIPLSMLGGQDSGPMTLVLDLFTLPIVFVAGALLFVFLRFSLRQIGRLVAVARVLMFVGVLCLLGAGGLYLASQAGIISLESLPIPR